MDKIFVLTGALGLIGFIYWFFLGKRDEAGEITTNVKVKVIGLDDKIIMTILAIFCFLIHVFIIFYLLRIFLKPHLKIF